MTRFPTGARIVFSPKPPVRLWPNKHSTHWVLTVLSLGITWPGREADHSPSSSPEVETIPPFHVVLHGRNSNNFTITLRLSRKKHTNVAVSIVQTNSAFLLFHSINSTGLQHGTGIRFGRILNKRRKGKGSIRKVKFTLHYSGR